MKILNIKNGFKSLLLLACFALTTSVWAAEPPAFLPEFAGGVQDNAVWQDANFFSTANQCGMQYKCGMLSNQPAKMKLCQAQVKTCIANYMAKNGASPQAIAFARYNEIPSTIDQIKRYDTLDVVYAKMQWADASGGFFIITKKGMIIPTFNAIKNINKEPSLAALQKQYPRAMLWNGPDNVDWPQVQKSTNGGEQVIFKYPVKNGCHACENIAYANIAYNFDSTGKYLGTKFLKLIPATQSQSS